MKTMNRFNFLSIVLMTILMSCSNALKSDYDITGKQSEIIVSIIDAVNEKDAEKYVIGFTENAKIYVESEIKLNGRDAIKANRENHFKLHPTVRSEIQHLVEIDNKVILNDKVWLNESDKIGQNIVEIFTFENGKIARVDVIQPNDLLNR